MTLETERLILRRFTPNDAEDIFEYLRSPIPTCFLDMKLNTLDEARAEALRRSLSKNDIMFAVCLKSTGKLIGELFADGSDDFGDNDVHYGAEFQGVYSPCWQFNPKYFGNGYATEAVTAYFDYLFNFKNARRIYAYTESNNIRSQNLCKRLGMRLEGKFIEFVSFINNPDGSPKYEDTLQFAILKKE